MHAAPQAPPRAAAKFATFAIELSRPSPSANAKSTTGGRHGALATVVDPTPNAGATEPGGQLLQSIGQSKGAAAKAKLSNFGKGFMNGMGAVGRNIQQKKDAAQVALNAKMQARKEKKDAARVISQQPTESAPQAASTAHELHVADTPPVTVAPNKAATIVSSPLNNSQPMRLKLPQDFTGKQPPIFIDNPVTRQPSPLSIGIGTEMVTQHTRASAKEGCCCCSKEYSVPGEYAIGKGPAKRADVFLSGSFNPKRDCNICCKCTDVSDFTFKSKEGEEEYHIYRSGGKSELFRVDDKRKSLVAKGITSSLSCFSFLCKTLCEKEFYNYPVELQDAHGVAVLTKRTKHYGCCGCIYLFCGCKCGDCCIECFLCATNCCCSQCTREVEGCRDCCACLNCNLSCCKSCCKGKEKKSGCCEKSDEKCCGCCNANGTCTCCGACDRDLELGCCTCFGYCGVDGACCKICLVKCPCCCPGKWCGGSCCNAGICGCCRTVSWMEPLETPTDGFYGPKSDESNRIVAEISHEMNILYTQTCWCYRKSVISDIYHTTATMPNNDGAEWINLLGYIGFEQHLPITTALW